MPFLIKYGCFVVYIIVNQYIYYMIIPYNPEAEMFYSQCKSYRHLKPNSAFSSEIFVCKKDVMSPLPLNDIQKKYLSYYERANKKGICFNITIFDFENIINNKCNYCGENASVVDRINSKDGYTKKNVQSLCNMCNMMKYTYSETDFLNHVKKIASRQNRLRLIEM